MWLSPKSFLVGYNKNECFRLEKQCFERRIMIIVFLRKFKSFISFNQRTSILNIRTSRFWTRLIQFWRFLAQIEHELFFRSFLASTRGEEERCFDFAFENSRNINLKCFNADTYVSSLFLPNKNLQCIFIRLTMNWCILLCQLNKIITPASRRTYNYALDFCANLSLFFLIKFFLFKIGCI